MIKIKITGMKKIQDKLKAIERRAKELHGQQFEIPATEEAATEAQKQLAQHVISGTPISLKKKSD